MFLNVVFAAVVGFSVSVLRAESWKKWTTPDFIVISGVSDSKSLNWAIDLQAYFDELSRYVRVDDTRPPLTVVILPNDAALAAFKPDRYDDTSPVHPAYFSLRRTGAEFLVTPSSDTDSARKLAYHMGLHWLVGGAQAETAAWYIEGLAGVFSSFSAAHGEVELGGIIDNYARALGPRQLMPVLELFSVTRGSSLYDEYHRNNQFYAQSWLFTHLLTIDEPNRFGSSPEKYFALLGTGDTPTAAFQEAFGMAPEAMDKYFSDFVHQGKLHTRRHTIDRRAFEASIKEGPASAVDVESALGQAALGTGNFDTAFQHLNAALTARPNDPALLLPMAELALLRRDGDACRSFADRAIASGGKNYRTQLLRALGLLQPHASNFGNYNLTQDDARAVCDELIAAVQLDPRGIEAAELFATLITNAQPRRDDDIKLLEKAVDQFPNSTQVRFTLASLYDQSGQSDKAIARFEQVRWMHLSAAAQHFVESRLFELKNAVAIAEVKTLAAKNDFAMLRPRLQQLVAAAPAGEEKQRWKSILVQVDQTEQTQEINTLIGNKEFDRARARIDELEKVDPSRAGLWNNLRRSVAAEETFAKAAATADRGEIDDAQTMIQDLIDSPDTMAATKLRARQILEDLKLRAKIAAPSARAEDGDKN